MILLVLSRLGSVRLAARTDLLSRRWRGLWTRLVDLAFCSDVPARTKAALTCFPESALVSSIHIRSPMTGHANEANSLLQAATLLSPAELVFVLNEEFRQAYSTSVVLPCFHRAISIEQDVGSFSISPPSSGEFPVLEKLSLAGCILDLGTVLGRCPRLRVLGVAFRGFNDVVWLDAALAALEVGVAGGLVLSFLGFNTRLTYPARDTAQFGQLLHAMSMLSPQILVFSDDFKRRIEADLPCFQRATSIEMNLPDACFTPLPDGEFSALERLSLSRGCSIVDLGTLISRCPRLRILKVMVEANDITVHSSSLQELVIHSKTECQRIDIMAPGLKQLQLGVRAGSGRELSVSISVPMVEKVSWTRGYTTSALMFGFWWLEWAMLESEQKEDTRSRLPRMNTLRLDISCIARGRTGSRPNFTEEMEKLLIANFSVLHLTLRSIHVVMFSEHLCFVFFKCIGSVLLRKSLRSSY